MKVGMIGLGKLGLPVSIALSSKHEVFGYDINPSLMSKREYEHKEVGPTLLNDFQKHFDTANIKFVEFKEVIDKSDLIFASVQTPHHPMYEGTVRAPKETKDFNYQYLINTAKEIAKHVSKEKIIVIISTVLPGTIRREILPILNGKCKVVYNPFFIAMGTVLKDFLNPEFALLGSDDDDALQFVKDFYIDFYGKDLSACMSIESAELCKVYYNTFITAKITLANTLMEMCHKIPNTNCDDIIDAISRATDRIISPQYLRGGMGDGGGCFPPDELVMTKYGPVEISSINKGDLVLTIDGTFAPVVKRWERQYDGDLIKIQVEGMPVVRETIEHPLYVREDLRLIKYDGRRSTIKPISGQLGELKPIEADKLEVGKHFAAWPVIKEQISRPEHATDEYCILAGWYLAEGSLDIKYSNNGNVASGRISIHLCTDEYHIATKLSKIMDGYDPPKSINSKGGGALSVITEKKVSNAITLRRGSSKITKLLLNDFGVKCHNKKLPDWVLYGDSKTQALILHGMINGDGGSYSRRVEFNSVSKDLAFGVMIMLDRLDIVGNLRLVKARGHKTKGGFLNSGQYYVVRVGCGNDIKKIEAVAEIPSQNHTFKYGLIRSPIVDGHRMRRILKIDKEHYTGVVYNLWVDHPTHTFVTAAGAQANCHPRDLIAMSSLSEKLNSNFDIYKFLIKARESQTEWLADLMINYDQILQKVILGKSFKPETNIVVGSPSILLSNILKEKGVEHVIWDPYVDGGNFSFQKSLFFIGTKHEYFKNIKFPAGSVVLDPHRYINEQDGVRVIPIGIRSKGD